MAESPYPREIACNTLILRLVHLRGSHWRTSPGSIPLDDTVPT